MLVSTDNMDPGKAGFMPMQVRNNASDLQNYLKGLEDWEADVKEKDVALSSHKSILKEVARCFFFYLIFLLTLIN